MKETPKLYPALPIMIVDDDPYALQVCELHLQSRGVTNIVCCQDGQQALEALECQDVSVMVLDLHMPELGGEEVLATVNSSYPALPVIISTAFDDVDTAVRCMRAGAFDYIVKPTNPDRLIAIVKRAIELQELRRETSLLKERVLDNRLQHPQAFSDIVSNNPKILALFRYIESISTTSQPVLITGETGVGKELFAKAIHRVSERKGELVAVNVAGLDDTTFSDSLFGHKRGAFTGAERSREGLIEKAANGTLFLDEIGDLSLASQVKLLRLLQEHEYYPLGADTPRVTNARVVVATNGDLPALQEAGTFRKDLYYRLLLHHVHLPPLRERRDDIPLLADFFLQQAADELNKTKPTPPPELFTLLSVYDFPGNLRELQAMIFDAVSRHESKVLSLKRFRPLIDTSAPHEQPTPKSDNSALESLYASLDRLPNMKEAEEFLIQEALKRSNGNRTLTANLLGVTRQTLHRRLQAKDKHS